MTYLILTFVFEFAECQLGAGAGAGVSLVELFCFLAVCWTRAGEFHGADRRGDVRDLSKWVQFHCVLHPAYVQWH
jgi:hypothetical protein